MFLYIPLPEIVQEKFDFLIVLAHKCLPKYLPYPNIYRKGIARFEDKLLDLSFITSIIMCHQL